MANSRSRRRNITLFLAAIAVIALAASLHHWRYGQWLVETENAQVNGNLVRVSALTGGAIATLHVEQGDFIEAGTLLLSLADSDARARYQQATAALALTAQELASLAARSEAQSAEVARHQAVLTNGEREHQRRQALAAEGLIADEQLTASASRLIQQRAALRAAEQQLVEIQRRLGSTALINHPSILQASAALRLAAYQLNKHQVLAPIDGYVAKRYANVGQLVDAGAPLVTLIDPNQRWVEANFKEDQLRNLRIGQPVQLYSDLYGNEQMFEGYIAGPALATGSQFALLPAQNATGNWVKILQRVPVRIEFSEPLDTAAPLPIGASLHIAVDTHERTGERLHRTASAAKVTRAATAQTDYSGDVEAVIAATIEQHLPQ